MSNDFYLGFVPLLRLLDVFGGQILILQTDVPQSGCQVRFSHLHVDLHVLLLMHLGLHLQHFLQYTKKRVRHIFFVFSDARNAVKYENTMTLTN